MIMGKETVLFTYSINSPYILQVYKKSLYLLIREMTGYPTHYITKVVNKMKDKQMALFNEFDKEGDIKI